jgi:hypothetical protein
MMIKFRDDIELIKCDLRDYENPPKEITNVRSMLDGVMGPWPVGTAMVDNSDFPGPVYRDENGEGIKHEVAVNSGDYLVKADGHIFYVPLTLFAALLKEEK